jgi:hypothetical protein
MRVIPFYQGVFLDHLYRMDKTHMHALLVITFLNLWWISLWGLSYLLIEYVTKGSKLTEAVIYLFMMMSVIVILSFNPDLIPHIA